VLVVWCQNIPRLNPELKVLSFSPFRDPKIKDWTQYLYFANMIEFCCSKWSARTRGGTGEIRANIKNDNARTLPSVRPRLYCTVRVWIYIQKEGILQNPILIKATKGGGDCVRIWIC